MSTRAKRCADRLRKEVPILRVLQDLGYEVEAEFDDREQQFRCDLHGDGSDSKPSARAYPETNQFFCFACAKSRDSITLWMDKTGSNFWDSVRTLEKRYNLAPLPWEASDEAEPSLSNQIDQAMSRSETADQVLQRVERFLLGLTQDRSLNAAKCATLWEAFDRIRHDLDSTNGESTKVLAHKILSKAKEALKPLE